jgi:hypothetical protein
MFKRLIKATVICAAFALPATVHAQDAEASTTTEEPTPAEPFTKEEATKYMGLGDQAVGYFFDGYADSLATMFAPQALESVGGVEGIIGMMDTIGERAGMVIEVLDAKMTRRRGIPQYWWEADFSEFTDEPLVLRYVFNEEGQISGAGVGPKSGSPSDPEG